MDSNGVVTSVGALGIDHGASCDRSYWNQPQLYTKVNELEVDWNAFVVESVGHNRRRALMRTLVSPDLVSKLDSLPVEAIIPLQYGNCLVYLGKNQHAQLSATKMALTKLPKDINFDIKVPKGYFLTAEVLPTDARNLEQLWQQFGWSSAGIQSFINHHDSEVVAVRNRESSELAGIMIAESLQFGNITLVELTEMSVLPSHQGKGLAKSLIFGLTEQCWLRYGADALLYGEFNLTTYAHYAALKAGMTPAFGTNVTGILHDHVAIEIGDQKPKLKDWSTEYIHSFQVMSW